MAEHFCRVPWSPLPVLRERQFKATTFSCVRIGPKVCNPNFVSPSARGEKKLCPVSEKLARIYPELEKSL
jgi:hypothetical protein